MAATVRAIFIKPVKGQGAVSVNGVNAVAGGFEGDHHTGVSTRRQILLVSAAVLNELQVEPGAVSENVIVEGMDVMDLQEGQRLRLGEAEVAVTIPCEPCIQMDRIRYGLRKALQNRRGMFVKVVAPGAVRVGDPVTVAR